jgi:hypothetical protein
VAKNKCLSWVWALSLSKAGVNLADLDARSSPRT